MLVGVLLGELVVVVVVIELMLNNCCFVFVCGNAHLLCFG
jgi:hypothetical protein